MNQRKLNTSSKTRNEGKEKFILGHPITSDSQVAPLTS